MLLAGVDGHHWSRAMGLQFPGVAKEHRARFQAKRGSLHVILTVAVIVAAQAADLLAPFVTQLDVNPSAFVPLYLQL